jgi:hypothetical protein
MVAIFSRAIRCCSDDNALRDALRQVIDDLLATR